MKHKKLFIIYAKFSFDYFGKMKSNITKTVIYYKIYRNKSFNFISLIINMKKITTFSS